MVVLRPVFPHPFVGAQVQPKAYPYFQYLTASARDARRSGGCGFTPRLGTEERIRAAAVFETANSGSSELLEEIVAPILGKYSVRGPRSRPLTCPNFGLA